MISVTSYIEQLTVKRKQRGLTLIELVFVVAILAILAGFLVPRLGTVRNLAAAAGNADQTRAALDQSVLYNIEYGKYPGGEDSLLDSTGAVYSKLDAGLSGVLAPHTLTVNEAKSINTQLTFDGTGGTPTYFYDADTTIAGANDAFISYNPVLVAGGSKVSQIKLPTGVDQTKNTWPIYIGVYGLDKLSAAGAPLDGSFLIGIGDGVQAETNSKTALGAPVLYTKDSNAYGRPVFLLRVFGTTIATYTGTLSGQTFTGVTAGTAAATAGALSPQGLLVTQSLAKYAAEKNR